MTRLILPLQIFITLVTTTTIYMIYALLDNQFGIDGLLGLILFQPIFGLILSTLTILLALLLGLPLRQNKTLHHWWIARPYIPITGAVLGLTLLIIAHHPALTHTTFLTELQTPKQIPNPALAITGWLLTTFSLLHTYPPRFSSATRPSR